MRAALPEGYRDEKRLGTQVSAEVYRAVRSADGREVVLKLYRREPSHAAAALANAQRELEALRSASGHGVPEVLELATGSAPPVLVLEYIPGVSLSEWAAAQPAPILAVLEIALQLAGILARIHAVRLLHRDVTPANVLVDPKTLQTHLIDFGLARPLGHAEDSVARTTLSGTPHYIAPEQTGRMNRGCDARADLYGLGATLYHALTGSPPFDSDDLLGLVHAHIARVPRAPRELRPDLPDPLSRLTLKLLSKEPTDRYQSATALAADLQALRDALTQHGRIDESFTLGSADAPTRPRFTRKLYGREREVGVLRDAYARAARGHTQLLLLSGDSGTGKSALVEQLRPQVIESGGYLAIGKFDLYRNRPYGGWVSALDGLVQQLLIETTERLERWRRELSEGLGTIARALFDLVPDLEVILPDAAPVPALGPRETRARLSVALQRLLTVCAAQQHPLMVLLDDLQWSDADSRLLLEDLVVDNLPAALLLIVAYRREAAQPDGPLAAHFARLRECSTVELLELGSLPASATAEMLADALARAPEDVGPLAQLVTRRTGDIPMLIRQFVEHLVDRGLIERRGSAGWDWDLARIAEERIPDGAAALMTAQIARLERDTCAVLEFASCVGDEFDLELLCELSGRERTLLESALYQLCDVGMIAPCAHGFRFVHDRIREAAHALLSEEARSRLHYETGRLLLSRGSEAEQRERCGEIVQHFNRGLVHVPESLRLRVIELNLEAGRRVLAAGAAAAAVEHFAAARQLFRDDDWAAQRALGLELRLQSAESAFQTREFDPALALLAGLESHSVGELELARIATKRLQVLSLAKGPEVSVRYALEVLRQLGVRWPLRPSWLRASLALISVLVRVRGRPIETLMRPATSIDPRWIARLLVLNTAGASMMRFDALLPALGSSLSLRHFLSRGYPAAPGFAVAAYALYLGIVLGRNDWAARYARAALALNERSSDPVYNLRTEIQIHALILPWVQSRRRAIEPLERLAERARDFGDAEYDFYARLRMTVHSALLGDPIEVALRRQRELAERVQRSGQRFPDTAVTCAIYQLLTEEQPRAEVERRIGESDAWIRANPNFGEMNIRTLWMMVLCVRGEFDLAFAQSEQLAPNVFRSHPFGDYTFYRGLSAAALADADSSPAARRRARRALRQSLRLMRRWARDGPDFVHMARLLEAEWMRLRGRAGAAQRLYEEVAQRAGQQHFPHHAALAHERHACMLAAGRRKIEARRVLRQAIARYRDWGARVKADALTREIRPESGF